MKKPFLFALTLLAGGSLLAGRSEAQQSPSPSSQTPAKPAPSSAPKKSTPATAGQAKKAPAPFALKTEKDKLSYAIGTNEGKRLQQGITQSKVDVDTAIILRAIKDVLSNGKVLLTDQEAQTIMAALQADMRKKQELAQQQAGEANKKEGEAFLAANKSKEGVITLPDGLQYKVLQEGTGPKPSASDTVTVNYRGTLLDGTEFDSSYKRGQPASFSLAQVIRGWTEALQLMSVGSKWEIFVPPDLAYGPRGMGAAIGPNATLKFEVELLSMQPKVAPTAAPTPTPNAAPTATPSAGKP